MTIDAMIITTHTSRDRYLYLISMKLNPRITTKTMNLENFNP